MYRILIVSVSAIIIFGSCRSTRNIQTAIAKKDTIVAGIDTSAKNLREDSIAFMQKTWAEVQANHIDFTTFSAKIDVDYQDAEGKKYDVNAHLRMYKDSVIWISITAILGIEGLRVLITPDSVKVLDKQNKTYSARSVSFLQEMTELPLDLKSLQDLLLGNPVYFSEPIISYSRDANTITMLSNSEYFKHLLTIAADDKLMQSSKLDDLDESRNRTCILTYSDYETKKNVKFTTRRRITVTEKKKLDIRLSFKQYDFNETLSFPFNPPKNYTVN
jgi:outer membrane biogenesis lipoprotein LolB